MFAYTREYATKVHLPTLEMVGPCGPTHTSVTLRVLQAIPEPLKHL